MKKTADQEAREIREALERRFLESLQAYDRLATRRLREWGLAEDEDVAA